MPRHFPILRISVLVAAVAAGLSAVAGVVAAVVFLILGLVGGRPIGGVINGVAAAAVGVVGAFVAAAIGEVAELLLEIHARLEVPDRLHDHLIREGQRTDERHLEPGQQVPVSADSGPHAGSDAEIRGAATGESRVQVRREGRAEMLENRGVVRSEIHPDGVPRVEGTEGTG